MKTKNKILVGLLSVVSCLSLTMINSFAYYENSDEVLLSNNLMSSYYYDYMSHTNNMWQINTTSQTETFLTIDFGDTVYNGRVCIGLGSDSDDIFSYSQYYTLNSTPQLVYFTYNNSIQGGYNNDDYNISEMRFLNATGSYEWKNSLIFNLFQAYNDTYEHSYGYTGDDLGYTLQTTQPYYIGCFMSYDSTNNIVSIEYPFFSTTLMNNMLSYTPKGKFYDIYHLPSDFISQASYNQGFNQGKQQNANEINSLENEIRGNLQTISSLNSQIENLNSQLENGVNWKTFAFAMADTPFKTISSMLGFEVLGVNLWKLLTAVITILMILWLLRKFRV